MVRESQPLLKAFSERSSVRALAEIWRVVRPGGHLALATLSDGSLITGELVGIDNGQYRIRSTTLGEMSVPESAIRSIQPPGSDGVPVARQTAPDVSAYGPEIASIQQQLATNPGLMGQITALQNDPAIQAVLADPELTRLILAGDLERLRADPRIQRLMEHPGIQGIVGQMAR